jgi:hypothetical protein
VGISHDALQSKMRKHGIKGPEKEDGLREGHG